MSLDEERFLENYEPKDYPSVALAVDLVVVAVLGNTLHAALVRHEVLATETLAFDHREILAAALERLAGKIEYTLTAAKLLPEEFALYQLRHVYEAVWNTEKLDAGNFTRKMTGALTDTGRKALRSRGAPAALFIVKDDYLSPPMMRPTAGPARSVDGPA